LNKPKIQQLHPRPFPDYEERTLSNGAKLVIIREAEWKVFRLEACFMAGRPFEEKKAVAKTTAELLREGSRQFASFQLAEFFEQNGASINSKSGIDTAHVLMHGLSDSFNELLPAFQEVVLNPVFPQSELSKFQKRQTERLRADSNIGEVIAYRKFTEALFGKDHPYGYNSTPKTYKAIEPTDLRKHHANNYKPDNALYLLSGGVTNAMVEELSHLLSNWEGHAKPTSPLQRSSIPPMGTQFIKNEGQIQASIKMGQLLFSYEHDDYAYVQIVNALLGGFFGSRLMKRVRQEAGLSYNIYSTVESMLYDGYWMIATETSQANVDKVIQLIHEELDRLASERIRSREKELMRNYLIGNSLQFFEGAFNKSDFLRHHLFEMGDATTYEAMMHAIQEMDTEKIRSTAEKYFRAEDLFTVVVK
jgi:predicted Zn-dependent peptidase